MTRGSCAKPWLWAWLAAGLVWLATMPVTGGQGGGQVLTAAFTFATFYVIVGLGQMFVITLGPGNVDLSIPATITLAGAVAIKVMDTAGLDDPRSACWWRWASASLVGCFNFALILVLRIPPIIATLSSSFLVQSAAIAYGRGLRIKPPPLLADFTTAQVAGVPVLAICVILLAAVMGVVLHRTVYGRSVVAIGQNIRAAHLAGVDVERTRFATYVMSAAARRPVRLSALRLLRRRLAQHGRGVPARPRSPSWSSAAPRSPAASPTSPACGARRCSCSWCVTDAQHLRLRRRHPLSRDRADHHRRDRGGERQAGGEGLRPARRA